MPTTTEVAQDHYREREGLTMAASAATLALWREINENEIEQSWTERLERVLNIVRGAQLRSARASRRYASSVLSAQGVDVEPRGEVVPESLSGIASDGRPLASLLMRPVVAVKVALARGATLRRSMATGQATLDMIVRTQVQDAGRVADGIEVATRPTVGYVRRVQGNTCARCLILAGRFYRYDAGFPRHPDCDCTQVLVKGADVAQSEGLYFDPKKRFDEMSREEQNKVFTKSGAEAIRDGADISQVVNARRGMKSAGTTIEGTTRRGFAGSRLKGAQRLMPEQIYRVAWSREEAVSLLRQHGYIV